MKFNMNPLCSSGSNAVARSDPDGEAAENGEQDHHRDGPRLPLHCESAAVMHTNTHTHPRPSRAALTTFIHQCLGCTSVAAFSSFHRPPCKHVCLSHSNVKIFLPLMSFLEEILLVLCGSCHFMLWTRLFY